MPFLALIVAHLLGDFVFQSNDLIQKKYKSWTGTLQHACIITAFTALALFPFWNHKETWLAVLTIFFIHFIQDCLKIEFDIRYNKKKSTLPFFADQILHVTLIYFLSPSLAALTPWALPTWLLDLYFSQWAALYLMGTILVSYTYDITLYQFLRQKSKRPLTYVPNIPSMLRRIAVFTVLYILLLLATGHLM